ncbi:asparaginase, partial [Enterococcus faecalis]|uniref:asparaginase n=1 Tax=Enterococcus faecalis TaxID=1351 RepID=UPI0021B0A127
PLKPVEYDNCNIPTLALSMPDLATLFAKLVSDPDARPVVESMAAHPVLVSDQESLDTCLMQVTGGKLIAKLGAGGMIVVANRATRQAVVLK